jgi:hypothetical protein
MHSASAKDFVQRDRGIGIIQVQNFRPGQVLKPVDIAQARTVVLKTGTQSVLVESIELSQDGSLVGRIAGFEPAKTMDFEGMRIGDKVSFQETHVFSVGD